MQSYRIEVLLVLILALINLSENRCIRPETPANGLVILRRNYVRFRCISGHVLRGDSMLPCNNDGRLIGESPVCAKPGCAKPEPIENGDRQRIGSMKTVVQCHDGYVVSGNQIAFCNGRNWDRLLGTCRPSNHSLNHSCDFETEDQCGWSKNGEWKRMANVRHFHSYSTGPRHDHTLQHALGGHYMLFESSTQRDGDYHLISPIYPRELSLKTACCFRFHYFMYGIGVGSLAVWVKLHSLPLDIIWSSERNISQKFIVSGSQGNHWLEHTIQIDEMTEDFQVVITAIEPTQKFGDIAIDDVQLLTGSECGAVEEIQTTTPDLDAPTDEPMIYDRMNCSNRCGEVSPGDDYKRPDGKWIGVCACDENCLQNQNCCYDYLQTCLVSNETSTTVEEEMTTIPATTPTTTSTTRRTTTTTTTKRTTTTKKATTTTKRTTTTTKKATTTKKITTPSTTSSTTTTKKPIITTASTTKTTPTTTTTSTTTKKPIAIITKTPTTQPPTTTTAPLPSTSTKHQITDFPARISWSVSSDDIRGNENENSTSPAHIFWYFMLGIITITVVASLAYRWRSCSTASMATTAKVKAVSFKKALGNGLSRGSSYSKKGNQTSLLSDNDYNGVEDGDNDVLQFEEMGVDIRNATVL
ncbi:uncharacterized protein LOC6641640 [Drosophila willistoni]|uniref:uncharacterized protein LOC6641640 n=1 Tax=Drosophila willistoni TaxID=7260 RepID=UPI00017D7118|nr:uncharacterized protein LOC6641640 [Drosophila willistoni]